MNPSRIRLLHKMIRLENNVGMLYACFSRLFPDDREFWKMLSIEEGKHASLLWTHLEYILDSPDLSDALLAAKEESIDAINERIERLIIDVKDQPLSREDAFGMALQLEQSAGESHFQNVKDSTERSVALTVFDNLSSADRDHFRKITEYMNR
jgi:hypothetical protein